VAVFPSGDGLLIHCALHAWVPIPSSSGRALKGLCCLSQTSIRGHFRDYITSVQLLTFHTFPFWMSGCIYIWRWTANPWCSALVGSHTIRVVKGPQGLVLSFSNEHSRGGHFRDYITSVQHLTFPFSMSGCISIWRWTANPLCSARVGSNPILVVKGPQGLVLSFSNEHTRPF